MLLLFFAAWIVFNGKITLEIILFGLVIAGLMFWFVCRFLDYSWAKERRFYRNIPLFGRYLLLLIREIVKANLTVSRMILSRREIVEPVIVKIPVHLKSESARVILANSVTLTPGTITVSLTEEQLLVHCLDKSLAEGMEHSEFVELLEKIEGEAQERWN